MSDEEPTAVETAPEPASESVTLKVPASQTEETVETPQSDATAAEDESVGEEAEEGSEDATDPTEGQEEVTPAVPVVNNTADGQSVTMPDGSVVYTRSHPYPVSNSEWEDYERKHQGDQPRYPYVPGDREYSPYSDPTVPNSQLAQQIERELSSYAERVAQDPNTQVSYIWNALHGVYEGELDRAIATGGGSGKVEA